MSYTPPQRSLQRANEAPRPPQTAKLTALGLLDQHKDEVMKGTPDGFDLTYDQLRANVMLEIKKNPALASADPYSLIGAVMQANQMGFSLISSLGEAYLLPFGGKDGSRVQLIIGYKGMIQQALNHPRVEQINCEVVYEGDHFEYSFKNGMFYVEWQRLAKGGERSKDKAIAFFAAAKLKDGGTQYFVMDREEVDEVEKRFRKGQTMSKPWRDDYLSMAKKTVIRRLFAWIPKTPAIHKALLVTSMESADHRYLAEQNLKGVKPMEETEEVPAAENVIDAEVDATAKEENG